MMNRRQVLKNLGLGAGALVMTPTVMSLLQSCTNEPVFNPVFVSPEQGHALRRMVDLIIPSSKTVPGAVDVGVHEFIDKYWKEVYTEKNKAHLKIGWEAFGTKFKEMFSKEVAEGKPEDFDQMLAKYLKISKEERKAYGEEMGEFYAAHEKDPSARPGTDAAVFGILSGIRDMTMWGWKSSEEIGKNVLWYDPVPGQQIGCLPLNEAGNGKAMSL